jgi:Domain of unknown function (DUF4333)
MATLIRAACVGLVVVAAGCGSETLDAPALEAEIKQDLTADVGIAPEAIDCPDEVEIEKGKRFECTGTAPAGDTFKIAVELTNDDGGFDAVVPPEQFE